MCAMIALSTIATASATEFGNAKKSSADNVIIVWAGDDGQKTDQATDMFSADSKNEDPEKDFIFFGDDEQTSSANLSWNR